MTLLRGRIRRSPWRSVSALLVLLSAAVYLHPAARAQAAGDATPSASSQPEDAAQLEQEVKAAQARIDALQKQLDANHAGGDFQGQLDEERRRLESIEERLHEATAAGASPKGSAVEVSRGKETTPGITTGLAPADIYDNGFFIATADKSYSLYVNGLFQVRYTGFKPQNNVLTQGESSTGTDTFDVFLGRFAASGSVFQPTLKYFLQFQGSTAGNSNTVTMLDWFTSFTFSKYLTMQVGRSWTPYTYEYYDNPGNYILPDLSNAEYAFVLPRAIGFEAYGQAGKFSWAGMVANSIPALDAGGQENFNSTLAYIGHAQVDILAPYGYVETDPGAPVAKPELTFWASVAYNPINSGSGFENVSAGDRTVNATSTIGFRYGRFTLQPTGYYRQTKPGGGPTSNNSWGFGEQAGFYLSPKRFEVAERISGVNWGAPDNPLPLTGSISGSSLPISNNWFSGPSFSYHRLSEDSVGLNYYLHGHGAKIQLEYSYLHGNTFKDSKYGANRVELQTQIMF